MLATAVTLSSCSWAHHEVQRALFDRLEEDLVLSSARASIRPPSLPWAKQTKPHCRRHCSRRRRRALLASVRPSVRPSRDSFPFPLLLLLRTDRGAGIYRRPPLRRPFIRPPRAIRAQQVRTTLPKFENEIIDKI